MSDITSNGVDAVLLDLYDTLAWISPSLFGRTWLAERTGADPDRVRAAYGATVAERGTGASGSIEGDIAMILEMSGGSADDELLSTLAAEQRAAWASGVGVFDDSLPSIERLRASGYRVALISNCSREGRVTVEALGIDRAMDLTVLSCELGTRKPEPGIYRAALDGLEVEPGRAVFVDDLVEYLDGAAALGIRTVQIDRQREDVAAPPDGAVADAPGAHPRIGSLAELDPYL